MDTEQMRQALQDRNLRIVAEATGINYRTLWRFARGIKTSKPHTLDVLRAYLGGEK